MRSATTTLRGEPPSVSAARRWTLATLAEWGLAETGWTAAQVVSELATNCALHARCDFTLRLTVEGERVRVEAVDGAPGGLQARSYSATATTGRGLRIVESLSVSWGVTPEGDGKAVWAVLPVEDVRRPSSGGRRDAPTGVSGSRGSAGTAPTGTVAFGMLGAAA